MATALLIPSRLHGQDRLALDQGGDPLRAPLRTVKVLVSAPCTSLGDPLGTPLRGPPGALRRSYRRPDASNDLRYAARAGGGGGPGKRYKVQVSGLKVFPSQSEALVLRDGGFCVSRRSDEQRAAVPHLPTPRVSVPAGIHAGCAGYAPAPVLLARVPSMVHVGARCRVVDRAGRRGGGARTLAYIRPAGPTIQRPRADRGFHRRRQSHMDVRIAA